MGLLKFPQKLLKRGPLQRLVQSPGLCDVAQTFLGDLPVHGAGPGAGRVRQEKKDGDQPNPHIDRPKCSRYLVDMQAKGLDILITAAEIQKRVEALAGQIEKDYKGKNLVVVGVLKGSFVFMADLVRRINIPLTCDFVRVASYDQDRSTGVVRMEFDMTQPVADKDVLLVEDIVDTGNTLRYLLNHFEGNRPASLKVCALLFKEVGSGIRNKIDYLGFALPNRYVVGYGLDSAGVYRSLPYIATFK